MNKTELLEKISKGADLSRKDAEAALNAFIETVEESLSEGEKVQITGFGSFEVRERSERKGRNPSTGEEILIEAALVPVFRAGRELKEAVKNS